MDQNSPFYAFKYMFPDNKFWNKFAIFFVLILCCLSSQFLPESADKVGVVNYLVMFTVFMTLAIFGQILFYGYYSSCVKSLTEQSENYVLPDFNFKNDGMLGLKCFVGLLLFGLAIFVVFLLSGIILGISEAVLYALNPILGVSFGIILLILITLAIIILSLLYYPSAMRLFAQTQDPLIFFNLKEIVRQIKESGSTYYKYIGIMILATMIIVVAAIAVAVPFLMLFKNPVFVTVIPCVIIALFATYANFVCIYSVAKCIK